MIKVAIISVVVAAGIGGYVWHVSQRPHVLEVYVFDTPGVPSVFIRTPNDKRVLINGGSNSDIVRRLSKVLPFYSRHIDYVIASDNLDKTTTGLKDVIGRYDVGEVFGMNGTSGTKALKAGETLLLDDEIKAEIIFPVPESEFKYSKASYAQILMKINYGERSIFFAGQATDKIMKFIGANATSTRDILIHKNRVNDIDIRKNGPVRIETDGHSFKLKKL